jgi:hypothetical protein
VLDLERLTGLGELLHRRLGLRGHGAAAHAAHGRQQDAREHGNDGDDHHQLGHGEAVASATRGLA